MDFLFSNQYLLEITCADPMHILARLNAAGVPMREVVPVEQWKIRLCVSGKYIQTVRDIANRLGCDLKITGQQGPAVLLRLLKYRLALVFGVLFLVVLTLLIPTRVLFIEVEGNSTMGAVQILEKAEQVGISFGASRKNVRSEKIKNALLQAVPQLKWAGINTYGCRAVISVIERDQTQTTQPDNETVQGIYALRDGIVSSITVTKGTALCKTGDAISAGQLLISGYTDCGLVTRAECAQGEVQAVTQRKIQAVAPVCGIVRSAVEEKSARWSIQLGKKRIKLYIGSGNSTTGCGKIYESFELTLPGGFRLPFSLIKETDITYACTSTHIEADQAAMDAMAADYITDSMIAGKILSAETWTEAQDDLHLLNGIYVCEEMIGKLQNEEIQ